MDLLEIHKRIRLSLNKDDTGYLTSHEIDRALDRAQIQEIRHLYGDDRKLPDSPLAYGMTLKIHADLLPFKRNVEYNPSKYDPADNPFGSGSSGVIVFPGDFLYPISILVLGKMVKIISEDEIGIRMSSIMRSPTIDRPVAVIGGRSSSNNINVETKARAQIFPEGGYSASLSYLKRPSKPNMVGTVEGRTFSYDSVNSTQMEWNDTSIDRVIERAIAILGENMQEDRIGGDNFQKAQA